MDIREGPPDISAPPNNKYLEKWSSWIAWQVGRWITAVAGRRSPRGQQSVVQAFIRGLEDRGEPLPGDRPLEAETGDDSSTVPVEGEDAAWIDRIDTTALAQGWS